MWTLRKVVTLVLVHIVAVAAGVIAHFLHVPLAWMLGPLLATVAIALVFDIGPLPRPVRMTGQTIVGSTVALYLTQEAVTRIAQSWMPLLTNAVLTVAVGLLIALAMIRVTRCDLSTAVLASVPGGPVEMAIIAERYGGAPTTVAISQALRIVAVVALFPPLLLLGQDQAVSKPTAVQDVVPLGLVTVLAIAAGSGILARRLGVINPFFLGPMTSVGILTACQIHLSDVPMPLVYFGQILLGTSLGAMFRREQFRGGWRMTTFTFGATAVLLLCAVGIAVFISVTFSMDLKLLLLGAAPGGVSEMAITARMMNTDVPLVTSFHIVRIFMVMTLIQPIHLLMRRLAHVS